MSRGRPRTLRPTLKAGFAAPQSALGDFLDLLGTKLFTRERTLVQYVDWAVRFGLLEALSKAGAANIAELTDATELTEAGVDSLLGVLRSLGMATVRSDGRHALAKRAEELLVSNSPYFVGDQFEAIGLPIPRTYLKRSSSLLTKFKLRVLSLNPAIQYGSATRLENQHARNLGACTVAVRTGEFGKVRHMLDVAGGSGAFAIPFALDHPEAEVTLIELPAGIRNTQRILERHAMASRVRTIGLDAFSMPWPLESCDGVFMGNFLHGFDDNACEKLCAESVRILEPGGRVWIHEMVWNDDRDGPLITALWHAAMRSAGPGRQRNIEELTRLLRRSGLSDIRVTPTASPFTLISGLRN